MGPTKPGERSPLDPDWEQMGIPVDEEAEPDDAEVEHDHSAGGDA